MKDVLFIPLSVIFFILIKQPNLTTPKLAFSRPLVILVCFLLLSPVVTQTGHKYFSRGVNWGWVETWSLQVCCALYTCLWMCLSSFETARGPWTYTTSWCIIITSLFFFYKADTCPVTVVSAFVWNLVLKFCDCVVLWSEVVSQVCQDNVEFCLQVCLQSFPARDLSAELWNAGVSGNLQWPFSNTFLFGARTDSYQDPQSNASTLSENSWFLCSAYRLPFPGVKCYRKVFQSLYSRCETCISLLGRPGNVSSSRGRQGL